MIIGAIDWTNFTTELIDWLIYPYTNALGNLFWPSIFAVIIAVSFVISNKNLTVVVGAILLTFGIFGTTNAFLAEPAYSLFFSVIAIAALAGTILLLLVKTRR